jgi:hypothetical protein
MDVGKSSEKRESTCAAVRPIARRFVVSLPGTKQIGQTMVAVPQVRRAAPRSQRCLFEGGLNIRCIRPAHVFPAWAMSFSIVTSSSLAGRCEMPEDDRPRLLPISTGKKWFLGGYRCQGRQNRIPLRALPMEEQHVHRFGKVHRNSKTPHAAPVNSVRVLCRILSWIAMAREDHEPDAQRRPAGLVFPGGTPWASIT